MKSLFNSILTTEQKHLLISGYLYHDQICHQQKLPTELIQIFCNFLDESIRWVISGGELIQFISAKNGEAITGPSFTTHCINFRLYLTPNGINKDEEGYVQFLAAPTFTSSNIDNITIWYSLCCKQTNSEWNNSTTFYVNDTDCVSWPFRTLSLKQITSKYTNILHKNDRNSQMQCCEFIINNNDKLEFVCYIDILNIEYVDNTVSYYGSNDIYMNKYAKFQWNIYDELLTEFRYSVSGKYYFKNINANWMLETAPNGQSDTDAGNFNLLLSLLRLPNRVRSVMVHMILHCDYNDIKWDFKLTFDYEYNQSYGWPEYTLLSSYLLSTTSITFTVQMTVLDVFDKNNNKIPQCKWMEYGIIDNTKELEKEFDPEFKQRHKAKLEKQQTMVHMQHCVLSETERECMERNIESGNECDYREECHWKQQLNKAELFVDLLMAASHALRISF